MASGVIFSESFGWASVLANLSAAGIGKWTSGSGTAFGTGNGRAGGKGCRVDGSSAGTASRNLHLSLGAQYTELTIGFAVSMISQSATMHLIKFFDGSTVQVDLRHNVDGSFSITRNGTVIAGPSATLVSVGSGFGYLWLRVLCHPSAGTVKLIYQGTTLLSATGLNTRASANTQMNAIEFGLASAQANFIFDFCDVVLIDGAVNATDKLADDIRVEYGGPDADGDYNTAWPPNTGTSRFGVIDEIPPNSDTDYIEAAAANDLVSVGVSDPVGQSGTIFTVVPWAIARKTDAGAGSVAIGLRQNSVDALGPTYALSTTYAHLFGGARDVAPDASAWDYTKINAAQLLLKRIA